MKIQPIKLGLRNQIATDLLVRIISFDTQATTTEIYYEVQDEQGKALESGNLQLTEEQFTQWSDDNSYIEDIVLTFLKLVRI